jgi:HK97 family phage major capsid protein
MDYVKTLQEKLNAQKALVNKAIEEKRAMTAEEQKQYDDLEKEIKDLEKTIEAMNAIADKENGLETPVEKIYAQPKDPNEKKWKGFGEFMIAVANAGRGLGYDNRLFTDGASGNSSGIGADGGFLIEKEFRNELLTALREQSQIANRITMIPIGPNKNGIKWADIDESSRADGSRHGGALAYWAAEAETVAASKIKLTKTEIELEKLMAFWYATSELLDDATAMEALARLEFANAMSFKVDDAIYGGSGVGMPLGMLKSGALITVAKESGQAADTIMHENIQKMWNRLSVRSRSNAVWFINQEVEPQLENMVIPIGTGGTISPLAREYMERGTLKNRPVIAIEQAEKLGDKGDILLCDPTQYIGIDKDGIQGDVSIHVKFLYDESCFRFIYRFNGAPRKNVAVASYKNASFTTSPFVTLAARD